MATDTSSHEVTSLAPVIRDCAAALETVVAYRLPPAMDRRLLWLSENKESLTEEQRSELLALVEFTEDRTLEKLQARAALNRLAGLRPDLIIPMAVAN